MYVNAAFRHTKNVGFQDDRNSHSLHFRCGLLSRPPASHQMGAGFGSEVVASLSSCWIFTSWRVWIYLGTLVKSVMNTLNYEIMQSVSADS